MSTALEVRNLGVSYHGFSALHDVNLTVPTGTMTAIIGPNGAGKSTFLGAALGLIGADSGTIRYFGERPINQVRADVAYVPQRASVDWAFPISVLGTAVQGTYPRLGLLRRPKKQQRALAMENLERVGIADLADRQVGALSGGQQQRMFLARALTQQAKLILLDEPLVGVDATSERIIVSILQELRDQGVTVMAVHHDLTSAQKYFDQALLINKTVIAHGPVGEVMAPDLLALAYHPPVGTR